MKTVTNLIAFMFCAVAFVAVAAQAEQSPSKSEFPYPNELPNLKLYQKAKWNSLQPYLSTVDDVGKLLGEPVPVTDDRLDGYLAFECDPDWTIVIDIVGKDTALLDSVTGHVLHINLYPKRQVPLIGADFSAFKRYSYTDRRDPSVGGTVYYDKFGLRYSVYTKDTADGRFRAGDLERIIYGPSDEATARFSRQE